MYFPLSFPERADHFLNAFFAAKTALSTSEEDASAILEITLLSAGFIVLKYLPSSGLIKSPLIKSSY